jgi:hypothetical protein
MSILMRILQRFDAANEQAFLDLERKFAELERKRPDYPKGTRLQPIAGGEPCNTLVWQCEFPDIASAYKVLDFFHGDAAHEKLLAEQIPYFRDVKIEFYKKLDY